MQGLRDHGSRPVAEIDFGHGSFSSFDPSGCGVDATGSKSLACHQRRSLAGRVSYLETVTSRARALIACHPSLNEREKVLDRFVRFGRRLETASHPWLIDVQPRSHIGIEHMGKSSGNLLVLQFARVGR